MSSVLLSAESGRHAVAAVKASQEARPEGSPDSLWKGDCLKKIPGTGSNRVREIEYHRKSRSDSSCTEHVAEDFDSDMEAMSVYSDVVSSKKCHLLSQDELIEVLGQSMTQLAQRGGIDNNGLFSGPNIPKISVCEYLKRMVRYINEWQKKQTEAVSTGLRALILSMIYVDRICEKNVDFQLTISNVHRLCMVAMLQAIKFTEDVPFPNSFWARVGGVSLKELNVLESQFLRMIQFELMVLPESFDRALCMFAVESC